MTIEFIGTTFILLLTDNNGDDAIIEQLTWKLFSHSSLKVELQTKICTRNLKILKWFHFINELIRHFCFSPLKERSVS